MLYRIWLKITQHLIFDYAVMAAYFRLEFYMVRYDVAIALHLMMMMIFMLCVLRLIGYNIQGVAKNDPAPKM